MPHKTVISLIVLIAFAAAVPLYSAEVTFFLGKVDAKRHGRVFNVSMGAKLEAGDYIETGSRSTLEISYNDGSRITVKEKSAVRIGTPSVPSSESITVVSGNVRGRFAKLKKGTNKVYTPTTVCAIRGTEFDITVRGGDSRVDLKEGSLELSNQYGSKDMSAGEKVQGEISGPLKEAEKTPEEWTADKEKNLAENPGESAQRFRKHLSDSEKFGKSRSEAIEKTSTVVKSAGSVDEIEKAGKDIEAAEETAEDDLYLSEGTALSVSSITEDFETRKGDIYESFKKLRDEANRVSEQKMQNYQAIQAVKEEYKKAREAIMNKFQDDRNRILDGVKSKNLKPDMNF